MVSLKAQADKALVEKKKEQKKSAKPGTAQYTIGTGDGISKSVRFLVNDETVAIETALAEATFKISACGVVDFACMYKEKKTPLTFLWKATFHEH